MLLDAQMDQACVHSVAACCLECLNDAFYFLTMVLGETLWG